MTTTSSPHSTHHDVVIIGGGFAGLCMAIALKTAGRHDFVLFEKDHSVGGTWRANHYPGAACDVPSNMYSFSFEPNPNWSRMYSEQSEILGYIEHCTRKYGITPHLRCGEEVMHLAWDQASQHWQITLQTGAQYSARVVVSGVGGLSRPALPKVEGLERFQGELFHSAHWDHRVDLSHKRVAVIGTGASAIQFIPQIAPKVDTLLVFQRTAPWIIPKPDGQIPTTIQSIFKFIPPAQRLARHGIYWSSETFGLGFVHPHLMKPITALAQWHLRHQISNPTLQAKLTPNYTIGCKRVLFSNNYYPALARDNVQVLTTGVREIDETGVIDQQGQHHAVDVVICGTGFDVQNPLGPLQVYDQDGQNIRNRQGLSAYLGIAMPQLPNLFFLLGPNTGLGHNSIIFMIEAQVDYTMRCLAEMDQRKTVAMCVRAQAEQDYNTDIQRQLKHMVWNAGGCQSWYLDEHGNNNTLWPGFTWKYWLKTRRPNFRHFEFMSLHTKHLS
jgi:cation diffusion facilitator CzcD-associated flavoprotein CzcO